MKPFLVFAAISALAIIVAMTSHKSQSQKFPSEVPVDWSIEEYAAAKKAAPRPFDRVNFLASTPACGSLSEALDADAKLQASSNLYQNGIPGCDIVFGF